MNIYESITSVLGELDYISKDKKSSQNYLYRGVDQVLNTLHPLFAKYKIFCAPEVLDIVGREERTTLKGGNLIYSILKVKYTFYAEDGTSISATVIGEAMDSGDKSMNKCMSVAFKYACFQTLCIPTEDTTLDPDDENEKLVNKSIKSPRAILREQQEASDDNNKVNYEQSSDIKNSIIGLNKDNMSVIEQIIKGSQINFAQVNEMIMAKAGKVVPIVDLNEKQMKWLVKTLKEYLANEVENG